MALRPQLLLRARELAGQRADLDAEDLVASDDDRQAAERRHAGAEVISLDALEGWLS